MTRSSSSKGSDSGSIRPIVLTCDAELPMIRQPSARKEVEELFLRLKPGS